MLQVQPQTKLGFIDVLCYYSPHFTSTILLDQDVLRSTKFAKKYCGQAMIKYFELDDEKINKDLVAKDCINVTLLYYQMDYGHCTLICIHHNQKRRNIEIPDIVRGGLCFTLPLILSDLLKEYPQATLLNSSILTYKNNLKFRKECDELAMQSMYEHQEKQHKDLMKVLT